MKAVTAAVAAAGIVGGVKADSWGQWQNGTSVDPVKTTTTSSTTTSAYSWGEWTSTTTSKKEDPTTSSTYSWEEWTSSSTMEDPKPTSTTSSASWGEWESSSTTTSSKKKADPTTTSSSTEWAEWSTSSTDPATSSTWADWDASTTYTTMTGTITVTKTVTPVKSTATSSVVTSTVSAAWSEGGWFGGAWPSSADGQCVMNVVTSYGYPIWKPEPSLPVTTISVVPTPSASSSTTSSKSTTAAEWTASSAAAFYSVSASSSASSSAPAKASSTGSKSGAGISSNGNSWAMTYSPYTASGGCKDAGTVSADIAKLASKGFTSVRVYSTDCSTLENVGAACRANNMKMILGVFISSTGISGAQGQVTDIVNWAQWDLVELIVVGNEAIFNNYCSASALAGFIGSCKSTFAAAGYTGAVTTTEDLATWTAHGSELCGAVDVVAANLYAFFNPNTPASSAGSFIQAQISELNAICGDKETYVMESGWPSAGECNGVACPGVAEQATAIKSIQSAVGSKIVFFSFEDEQWKQPGEFNVEQHWGCGDVFADNNWATY